MSASSLCGCAGAPITALSATWSEPKRVVHRFYGSIAAQKAPPGRGLSRDETWDRQNHGAQFAAKGVGIRTVRAYVGKRTDGEMGLALSLPRHRPRLGGGDGEGRWLPPCKSCKQIG